MKFLIDANLGERIKNFLAETGHDVIRISGDQANFSDYSVLEIAFLQRRIIITNDKDFGALVFKEKRPHSGIILLRLENNRPEYVIEVLHEVLKLPEKQIKNRYIVITEKTIRIR